MTQSLIMIDEEKLEQDVTYRVQFLSQFMGMTHDDYEAIKKSAKILGPLVDGLVDAIYDKLFSFSATKRQFLVPGHGVSEEIGEITLDSLTLDNPNIKFRKTHLKGYLVKLVSGPYNKDFIHYIDFVGEIHTSSKGNPLIHIPLVQISALFGFVSDAVLHVLINQVTDKQECEHMIRAWNKLLWIQQDLFIRHYKNNKL